MLRRNSPCNMSQGVLRRISIKCDSLAGLTGLVEAILTLFQSYIPILIVYISFNSNGCSVSIYCIFGCKCVTGTVFV